MSLFAPKVWAFLVVSVVTVCADRFSKAWIDSTLALGEQRVVIEGWLYLTHARNDGAAFGLLSDSEPQLKLVVFAAAAGLAVIVVLLHLIGLAPGERRVATALGLVAGGAIGNLADRLPQIGGGEVIDFLHVDLWGGYDWPDFNLADVAIVLGVAGLLVDMIAREAALRADHDPLEIDDTRA